MNSASIQPIPPYESEAALWEEAYCFLLELRQLRGLGLRRPDHEAARGLVSRFCLSLRQCPHWLSLPRIQKEQHLSDSAVVVITAAMAAHFHMPQIQPTLQQVGVLAFGFEPTSLVRFRKDVRRGKAIGKFIQIEQRQQFFIVHPSELLISLIGITMVPLRAIDELLNLPTAPASRDIDFKRGRK